MGIWKQLAENSCGATQPTPSLQAPASYPLFREEQQRVGMGGGQSQGLTGNVDLDRDFSPAYVVLRPAGHVLSIEVTGDIGQGQRHR